MPKPFKPPYPEHPTVDWGTMKILPKGGKNNDTASHVLVTCPWCKEQRFENASQVKYRVTHGTFTGYCYKDRLISKARADRLPRLPHPAVDWDNPVLVQTDKQRINRIRITCPKCGEVRLGQIGATAAKIRDGSFTGECLPCSGNARKRDWVTLSPGRKIDPIKGYVRVQLEAVRPEHHYLWHAMKGPATFVFEHRLEMAKKLGRPLASNELVDHMDGDKLNNDTSNLRIYIRGRNDPGSHSGYGTYYHELQEALAEVGRLKKLVKTEDPSDA